MSTESFLDGRVTLHGGDCLAVLAGIPDNSVDAIVTDPPYHLTSIVKRFGGASMSDNTKTSDRSRKRSDGYARLASGGFMGKQWDGGDIAFRPEVWQECLRVLKPGGYLLAFASTRGFGRMQVAIEDAGFITHPMIAWVFGSGFPKAHDAARALDRELGAKGAIVPSGDPVRRIRPGADQHKDGKWEKLSDRTYQPGDYAPATADAAQFDGFAYGGQALKPALEPIYMGQKPFSEKNGAANLLKWGTGALNIDGCRIPTDDHLSNHGESGKSQPTSFALGRRVPMQTRGQKMGRWPANLIHDGSDEVLAAFPDAPGQQRPTGPQFERKAEVYGQFARVAPFTPRAGAGSAARFFYTAKADSDDRIGSRHPTVKPVDLMRYLVRLTTPPSLHSRSAVPSSSPLVAARPVVLDPFAGTGTTGEAAWREGCDAILIEREAEYREDIATRMALAQEGARGRKAAIVTRKRARLDPQWRCSSCSHDWLDPHAVSADAACSLIPPRCPQCGNTAANVWIGDDRPDGGAGRSMANSPTKAGGENQEARRAPARPGSKQAARKGEALTGAGQEARPAVAGPGNEND